MSISHLKLETSSWALLTHYLRPHRLKTVTIWLLLLGTIATQLINPQIIGRFLDAAEAGKPLNMLLGAALLFLAIAIVEQVLGLLTTYLSTDVGWRATNQLREDVALHCLRLDLGFHKAHGPGEMIERIDGDVNALGNFFSRLALNLINNLLLLVGVLLLLWLEDWRIGASVTVIVVVGLISINYLRSAAVPYWRRVRQVTAELYGSLEEWLGGTEDIRGVGAAPFVEHRLYRRLRTLFEAGLVPRYFQMAGLTVPILLFGLAYMAVFVLGDHLVATQEKTVGSIYVIFFYLELLSGPIWQIVNEVRDLQTAGASVDRVQELLQAKSAIVDGGTETLPPGPLAVAFSDVTFRYEETLDEAGHRDGSGGQVLDDINFQLAPGEVLGLLGRTGSGKTTLTRLLPRLIDPSTGSVSIGASPTEMVDLRALPLAHLRQRVSMVTQDVQLFSGTLRDNLTFYDDTIDDAKLLEIVDELGLDEWLAGLNDGLATRIGPGGSGLSAGEAQLVAFLRLSLQDPGLVILDEASSRLDPSTERLLDRAAARLLAGRTGIVIAHRLQTVARTDKILILEAGRIQEFGDRKVLAADIDARYYELLQQGK